MSHKSSWPHAVNTPIGVLVIIYLITSLTTFLLWNGSSRYNITGDEPHYLVIASGIVRHGTLEQSVPYKEEFEKKEIYKSGLADTHVIHGPNGLFSVHNIGLPLLISLPFYFGGVVGVKLFMIFVCGVGLVVAWTISGAFSSDLKVRFFATLATYIALPLIPASNQIYPDIVAGVIALGGLYWFMTTTKGRSLVNEGLWAGAIAFLPWLQIKFAATCLVLIVALGFKILLETKDIKRISLISVVAIVSYAALGLYNYYAFRNISGPYTSEALQLSKTSLMVLLGLHFDQNQGFLLQNPIALVGVFFIGALFVYNKSTSLLLVLVFLSLIVPNGMHPNWYGGWSFSGRFAWSAAIIFFLPTIFGLIKLADINTKAFSAIIGASLLLQSYLYCLYSFGDLDLYNKVPSTWLASYSLFYFPIESWMPALYNARWAYEYAPNYAWGVLIVLILAAGFATSDALKSHLSNKVSLAIVIVGVLIVFASGFAVQNGSQEIVFVGKDLPSRTGQVQGLSRVATQGVDDAGVVTFGPYVPLRMGSYEVMIRFSSAAPVGQAIGKWDVFDFTDGAQLAVRPLYGTAGEVKKVQASFKINNWKFHLFEFRSVWDGTSDIKIYGIELKPL